MHVSALEVIGEIFPPIYVLLGALALVTVAAAVNLWLTVCFNQPVTGADNGIRRRKEIFSRWLLGTAVVLGTGTLVFFFGFVVWTDFYSWQNHF